jgi:cyclopentanol dehydrogenase
MPRLEGKVALISGGARGQGACEGRLFAQEGAKVVLTDILDEEGESVAAEIRQQGGDAIYVRLDVTQEQQWQDVIQATVDRYGKLDILVNNAGIFPMVRVEDTSVELWEQVMDINVTGVFLGTKHAIPAMRTAGGGSIINISSVAGLVGGSRAAAYSASKGAVRILTKGTAVQYASDGIRANSVHPGIIVTQMTEELLSDEDQRAQRLTSTPLGRFGTADDVAYGVLFLASDESSYVTGSELVIDGGSTAQ